MQKSCHISTLPLFRMFAFSLCYLMVCGIHLIYSHAEACSYPYRRVGKNCYLINQEKVTADTAFAPCIRHGTYLANFETLEELLLMKYELKKMNSGSSFFIGGRNVNRYISGGDWRWIKQGKMTKMAYFDFDSNEPNGSLALPQDCVLLNAGSRYNLRSDTCDAYSIGFICEK
ncbi:macrophage mannose receptor 1-like [Mytilus trossulus]|uniref:macrophage mannose receptor 1-like n=1 Tax=Mytilus trossulus TaxID=6551 RepID=UPI003005CB87